MGTFVGIIALWMSACCFCGFKGRFIAFLAVLFVGLAANMSWMVFGLSAHVLEPNALIAQVSALLYAFCAFGTGLFAGRIQRAWVDSRVEEGEV